MKIIDKLAQEASKAALDAGKLLKDGFGTTFGISSKEGINNLVTDFDYRSEKMIIDYLKSKFPESIFLAEESGFTGKNTGGMVRWIIDPLDGTVNFAHSIPIFSVSIAAEIDGELLCGVIYHPLLEELFVAIKGGGSTMNGKPISVSKVSDFERSFLVTGFPYNVSANPCNCISLFVSIIQRGIPVRRLGSAALDLAYVAAGRFDGFWEIDLHPWDVAAGILLVSEAGGNVTQFDNSEYMLDDKTLLATNGLIHSHASSVLSECICKC
ncbi:MAG: Inositol-monophosphatase [Bacteroidota bacterium]|nr:Inositol-monophosphatase [Bacteroidota bacterium]